MSPQNSPPTMRANFPAFSGLLALAALFLLPGSARAQCVLQPPPPGPLPPVEVVRTIIAQSIEDLGVPATPVASVEDVVISHPYFPRVNVPVRIYRPFGEGPYPLIVNVHGAAWVAGSVDTHDNISRRLADEVGAVVVSVNYALAPENPFPAAVRDTKIAILWSIAQTRIDSNLTRKVAVVGDSAGGNILAGALTRFRFIKRLVAAQVLINPAVDLRPDSVSYATYTPFIDWYLHGADPSDPRASPLLARFLRGLPDTYIVTSELDPIAPDGDAYFQELESAGVSVELFIAEGQPHLAEFWAAGASCAQPAIDFVVDRLRDELH